MQNGEAVAASLLREGAAQPRFSDACWSDQQDVLMLPHPFAAGERADQLAVQPAWMLIMDIFDDTALL